MGGGSSLKLPSSKTGAAKIPPVVRAKVLHRTQSLSGRRPDSSASAASVEEVIAHKTVIGIQKRNNPSYTGQFHASSDDITAQNRAPRSSGHYVMPSYENEAQRRTTSFSGNFRGITRPISTSSRFVTSSKVAVIPIPYSNGRI